MADVRKDKDGDAEMPPVPSREPEFYASQGVSYQEGQHTNSRGMKLFTMQWLPMVKDGHMAAEPKALVFLLHGFAVDCGTWWEDTGLRLAKAGFATFGIDFEGHGRSEGMRGFIPSFDQLVADTADYFRTIREREQYSKLKRFLMGESMGGAVALMMAWKEPNVYDGAVLVAPMCKISDKLKPPPPVTFVMKLLARVGPTWAILPTDNVVERANRDPVKRKRIMTNPLMYMDKPRLGTGLQLLNASEHIARKLNEVAIPFLVLHGSADTVTELEVSKELHERAASTDKTIKVYTDMWHGLTCGELDENIDSVFADIISWLGKRSEQ